MCQASLRIWEMITLNFKIKLAQKTYNIYFGLNFQCMRQFTAHLMLSIKYYNLVTFETKVNRPTAVSLPNLTSFDILFYFLNFFNF